MNIPASLLPIFYGAAGGIVMSVLGAIVALTLLVSRQRPWVVRLLWISIGVGMASGAAIILVLTTRGVP